MDIDNSPNHLKHKAGHCGVCHDTETLEMPQCQQQKNVM